MINVGTYYETHELQIPERRKILLEADYYDASRDPDYVDEIHIGDIDLKEPIAKLVNEESFGQINLKKYSNCKLYVYGNEGQIPHFHIFNNDHSFDTCICLHKAMYFVHKNIHRKSEKLSTYQKIILQEYLNSTIPEHGTTIWKEMMIFWKGANENCVISNNPDWLKIKIPDYTKLNDSIHE